MTEKNEEPQEVESNSRNEFDGINFLPGIEESSGSKLEGGTELLQRFGIVPAYKKWIGKSEPTEGRTESIMISCPMPNHRDLHPSAWANSEKNLWHCGVCQIGGDVVDLVAIGNGFDFPSYRTLGNPDFVKVLEIGLRAIGVDPDTLRSEPPVRPHPDAVAAAGPAAPAAPAAPAVDDPDDDDPEAELERIFAEIIKAGLDWRWVLEDAPESFLAAWMDAVKDTDLPDEFLFWLGLQMVGLAIGRDCALGEGSDAYPNLWLALLGPTGAGKSRAIKMAGRVLQEALPFDPTDASSKGVSFIPTPASGETLYEEFEWIPENTSEPHPLRGLVEIDEMKELMAVVGRKGSTLREAMISLGDGPKQRARRSRTHGLTRVKEPFMAIAVGGQPDAMGDIMDKNDMSSGFANRFIYVPCTLKERTGWHDRISSPDFTGLADRLKALRSWASNHRNSPQEGVIELDIPAGQDYDQMCSWFDQVRERPDGDLYARLELHAMKLITILSVNRKIDIADVRAVAAVRHLIESTMAATEQVSESLNLGPMEYYRRGVVKAIEKCRDLKKLPPTRSDINRSINHKRRNQHSVGVACKELERSGVIAAFSYIVDTGLGRSNRTVERWYFKDEDRWWE